MAVFEYKVFNDPIHGHIELHPLCIRIIDTPQFQRLRYIKQLGGCYLVFPGASHNRFEHSIGVSHLAGKLAKAIQQRQPELAITDQDILCVQIAGLCHDLGHGPFSHMFQDFIHTVRQSKEWKHEKASVQMFEHLLEENNLRPVFESYRLTPSDIIFIKEQIAGPFDEEITRQNWPYSGRDGGKSFLYEIVANKRNGIDVDKWDYFARDCYHLGIKSGFDHHRFIGFCRVISDDGVMQICNRDKEVFNVYDMFHIRSVLHRTAYQHKTAKIVEIMITEALQKADEFIMIEGKDGKCKISRCIDDMVAYTKLTDNIYHNILYSSDPCLSEARDILRRIESRKLYKCVGHTKPSESSKASVSKGDGAKIREQIASSVKNSSGEPLITVDDIVLSFVKIDYGKEEDNPIDRFRFYAKSDLNKAISIKKEQVSPMLPSYFSYQFMVVYSRKLDSESIKNISTGFKSWCKKNNLMECEDEDV